MNAMDAPRFRLILSAGANRRGRSVVRPLQRPAIVTASANMNGRLSPLAIDTRSAASPIAIHARRDHGAARSIFLHVSGRARPHRVRSRIVAGVDIRLPLVLPVDWHSAEFPPALCGGVRDRRFRSLRGPQPGRRGLGLHGLDGQQKSGENGQCRRRHNPLHSVHPAPVIGPHGLRLPRQGQPGGRHQNQ